MEFTTAKAGLCFLVLISLCYHRALAEGVDLENAQVVIATPGVLVRCERVNIYGLSRLKLGSYSSAHRITVTPSDEIPKGSHKKIQICSHRNPSLALCQCDSGAWGNIKDGTWSALVSPYEDRYIDVKFVQNLSGSVEVSVKLEFQTWRFICLIIGLVWWFLSPNVSSWVPFDYVGSMVVAIFLLVIFLLFEGMKLVPRGRIKVLYAIIFSLMVLLFSVVVIVLAGVCFGLSLVVAEDGIAYVSVDQFVTWASQVLAATSIFLSTLDFPLAMLLLLACRMGTRFSLASMTLYCTIRRKISITFSGSMSALRRSSSKVAEFVTRNTAKNSRVNMKDFYSTFHKLRNNIKFSKEDWKSFTEESTRQAVAELASSPEFTNWIIKRADRIHINPRSYDSSSDESVSDLNGCSVCS